MKTTMSKVIGEKSVAEKVMDLLERAEILDISGYLLHNWQLETLDCESDDEIVFSCSYTDEEGLIYEFEFSKKAFEEARITKNEIQMTDNTGELVDIACYKMIPLLS